MKIYLSVVPDSAWTAARTEFIFGVWMSALSRTTQPEGSNWMWDLKMGSVIASEEGNLNEDVKKGILISLLVAAGITLSSGGWLEN